MPPPYDEMIHLYADGELPFGQQGALFAHLAADEDARHLLESVMQFRRMSRQETFPVTPAMDAAFMQRLSEHRRGPRRPRQAPATTPLWQKRARISLRSATLLAIVILLLGVWGAQDRSDAPARAAQVLPAVEEEPVVMSAQYVFTPGVVVEAERQ